MGNPPQVTLVLLPGLDGTGRLFKALLAALPGGLNPLVVSLPQDGDQSYAALAAYVTGRLPAAAPFVLLGESFSGPLALRVAAECGTNLMAVILVASRMAQPTAWLPSWGRYLMRPFLVPILYLAGKQDRMVPAQTVARLRSLRPSLTCVVIDALHFLLQRNPVEAARAIAAFVFGLVRAAPVE